MDNIASLNIKISSLEADIANSRIDRLARSGAKAERATDGLVRAIKGLAVATGAAAGLAKLVSVAREFDVLNAQLVTATGSADKAAQAFGAIQDFASQTPYDLAQVTNAFTQLVNLGLSPSEAALTSYGNTAAAMGKDLSDLVGAVAAASVGEFERLKTFGIKAKSEGDRVSFTFRGVTTEVGKNAAEIEAYLRALGDNEFAGAMQQRVNTLDGAISNLGDEWNKLFLNISNAGVGDLIQDSVRLAIDIITEFNDLISSGQLEASVDAILSKFDGFGRGIAASLDLISEIWADFLGSETGGGIAYATSETLNFIVEAFKNLPENLSTVIQLMGVEIATLVDYGAEYGAAFARVVGYELARLVEKSKIYGRAIGEAINPFSDDNFDLESSLRNLDSVFADLADEEFKRADARVAISREARRDSIAAIIDERDAALASFDAQIAAADRLRQKYDEEAAARKAAGGDRLAEFQVGGDGSGGETKQEARAREARADALEKLRLSLRTEEEEIQESYSRRLAIILENTEQGSVQQADLKRRLDSEFATQSLGGLVEPDTYQEQLDQIQNFYDRRRELILGNVAISEEQKAQLEEELSRQRNERLIQLERARMQQIFESNAETFDSLAGLAKTFAGEQSKEYKALFAISQAFSIAQTIMKTYESAQSAYASLAPIPYVGPALGAAAAAAAVAAGASNIAQVRGASFSGAYDSGGIIPQGRIGLVGEFGPELVEGPANVRSRRDTAEIFRAGADQSQPQQVMSPPQVNIKNINVLDPSVVGDYLATDEGEQVIMNVVQRNQRAIGF